MARPGRPSRPAIDLAFVQRIELSLAGRAVNAIAAAANIGEGTIRGWRCGAQPTATSLTAFAAVCGVSVEWLLTGKKVRVRVAAGSFPRPRYRVPVGSSPVVSA